MPTFVLAPKEHVRNLFDEVRPTDPVASEKIDRKIEEAAKVHLVHLLHVTFYSLVIPSSSNAVA